MATGTLHIGQMTKKINSCNQSLDTKFDVTNFCLKEPTSNTNPIFKINGGTWDFATVTQFNYLMWQHGELEDSDYYWIDDIISVTNDIYEIHCHRDPLATFKQEIIDNTSGLVEFTSNSTLVTALTHLDDVRFGPDLINATFSKTAEPTGDTISFNTDKKEGTVILTTICASGTNLDGISNWIMSAEDFGKVMSTLKTKIDATWSTLTDQAEKDLYFGSPNGWSDYVLSAVWIPLDFDSIADEDFYLSHLYIGPIQLKAADAKIIHTHSNYRLLTYDMSFTIPWPDIISTLGIDFLKNPRFTSLQLYTPFGTADISSPYLVEQNITEVKLKICINSINGDMSIRAYADDPDTGDKGVTLYEVTNTISMNIMQYAQPIPSADQFEAVKGGKIASGIGTAMQMIPNPVTQVVGGIVKTVGTGIAQHFDPGQNFSNCYSGQCAGLTGLCLIDGTEYTKQFYLIASTIIPSIVYNNTDSDNFYSSYCDEYGYPYKQYDTIANILASAAQTETFIKFNGCSTKIKGATAMELSYINEVLNSGIYINGTASEEG